MSTFTLLFLEKICEAIYFSMFLLIGKNIKEKRLLFTIIMIVEYLMLTTIMEYNVWIQILYTFMSYINLKVLYGNKAQITDIFLFTSGSIILMAICGFSFLIFKAWYNINQYCVALIISRVLMFGFIIIFNSKINMAYKSFYKLWNRHNNKNKMKSLTLRNISIILFNFMFYIINLAMGLYLIIGRR